MRIRLLASLLFLGLAVPCTFAGAPGTCCSECGCTNLVKVCTLVPEVIKKTETKYCCETEDICLPGPSRCCGVTWVPDARARCGERRKTIWEPTCGLVVTRKKLKKETVTVEEPGFKCVVETVCGQCGVCCH